MPSTRIDSCLKLPFTPIPRNAFFRKPGFIHALAFILALCLVLALPARDCLSQSAAPEQAKTLRNQGFSLMREGRTAEALEAYRSSLQLEEDDTVQAIVRKLEAQLAKEQAQPSPVATPGNAASASSASSAPVDSSPAASSPVTSSPAASPPAVSSPGATPDQPLTGADADKARQLRQQAFALSSQGHTNDAAALYRQSLQYEDSPQVRMILSRMEQAEARKAAMQEQARKQAQEQTALNSRHAPGMSRTQIVDAQRRLAQLGYTPGSADGVMGRQTIDALRAYQRDQGLEEDGVLNLSLAARLEGAQTPVAQSSVQTSGQTAGQTTGQAAMPASPPMSATTGQPAAPPVTGSAASPYGVGQPAPAPSATSPSAAMPSAPASIPSDCEQGEAALTAETERIMMQSDSLGACMSAKEYQRIMRESAALMRRCPQLDTPDSAQAREYDRVAQETQETINATCH